MLARAYRIVALIAINLAAASCLASPWVPPGDLQVRSDLALLVDAGRIDLPLSSWPISQADVARAVSRLSEAGLGDAESAALERIRKWTERADRSEDSIGFLSSAAVASRPTPIRTFASTPREAAQFAAGAEWTHGRWFGSLNATVTSSPKDGQPTRPDGSVIGGRFGNWLVSAGWMDRWWGPGQEGSLILSTNARPMPGLSLDRAVSESFESPWLHWLGPWSYSMFVSRMEGGRADVSRALFFGQRFVFRPLSGLELGVTRTAQFCGSGRMCNADTVKNMLFGSDNRGDNVSARDEPGNQMAGFDARFTPSARIPLTLYTQWIGEDQQGGIPFKYLGLFGVESWRSLGAGSLLRVHVEFADTACSWYRSTPIFGCAYSQSIFHVEGYRYRGRSIGDSIDADGRELSAGLDLSTRHDAHWQMLIRRVSLDRSGVFDPRNQVSPVPRRESMVDLRYQCDYGSNRISIGVAVEEDHEVLTGRTLHSGQGFLSLEHRFRQSP